MNWPDEDMAFGEPSNLVDTPVPRIAVPPKHDPEEDTVAFARTLGFQPDPTQTQLLRCQAPQLILNCCRQWGKSTVAAIKAVHRARLHPKSLVVVASPTERQSAEFLLKARGLVRTLGMEVRGDGHNRASLRLPNGSRIVGLPGNETNIRGFSAVNLLIIDEAARVTDELYKALRPMLTVANGDVWLLSTPKGKLGFFHENWEYGGDAWARFRVPATECSRISKERLEMERGQMDDAWFRQEYLCEFLATDRQMFDADVVSQAMDDGEGWDFRGNGGGGLPFLQALAGNPVFVGLDLGQRRDHSAIAVIEREDQRVAWGPVMTRGLRVRHLERIPLGTSYTRVVERVREIVRHPLLAGRCRLVTDATGVGGPVVDLLKAARLDCPLTAVTITSGERAHSDGERWHVPKNDLLAGLLVLLEQGNLKIGRSLKEAGALVRELNEVEVRARPGRSLRMGADGAGEHDDLVVAVALACWRAQRKELRMGTQRLV